MSSSRAEEKSAIKEDESVTPEALSQVPDHSDDFFEGGDTKEFTRIAEEMRAARAEYKRKVEAGEVPAGESWDDILREEQELEKQLPETFVTEPIMGFSSGPVVGDRAFEKLSELERRVKGEEQARKSEKARVDNSVSHLSSELKAAKAEIKRLTQLVGDLQKEMADRLRTLDDDFLAIVRAAATRVDAPTDAEVAEAQGAEAVLSRIVPTVIAAPPAQATLAPRRKAKYLG
jgi:hypothetical protein